MKYFLGVDLGSINVKLALINENGQILHLESKKITSNPKITVNYLLSDLNAKYPLDQITAAGVSGTGKKVIPSDFHWTDYSSSLALASGILQSKPEIKTIIQIGGQTSLVIELEDGLKKPWKVVSNPLCAAGTGRFLEQQAYRLGIPIEDFASLAVSFKGQPPRIAARCSVFAKSDLIHLQQKGVSVEAMLCALSESIARMVVSLKKGAFAEPICFVGGVAANGAIVKALNEILSARNGHQVRVSVPPNFSYMEALGCALLSRDKQCDVKFIPESDVLQNYLELPKLESVSFSSNGSSHKITEASVGYLGVDVGSTSTKAVIMDSQGKQILLKNYLMTAGRPVDAVKQVFANLLADGADKVTIAGVGVTGSGRYLIGSLIGADLIKNEITAQTRAAAEIDPDADIIEIGGQDSKLVIKRNGVVIDYQMNKACAAGTGSFIDEMAEMIGVSVKSGDFADLALTADHTIDLGTRCAAFMGQAVPSAQQAGVPQEVIVASLANSIAKNYLSKVVGTRKFGEKIILTGAVFYNQAVISAFKQQLTGKNLMVAEHREVSGAMGAALLAREFMEARPSRFKGFKKVIDASCNLSTFTCQSCENNCSITQMKVQGEKPTFYGSRCDKYDSALSQARKETSFDVRERLLFREYKPESGSGVTVGLPRSLLMYDFAPLFIGFLNSLGVKTLISGKTNKEIVEQAVELAYSDSCFPIKLLHGHVAALKEVDYILFPSGIRLGKKEGSENQKYACPLVQASPFIVRQVLDLKSRILIPFIDFSMGEQEVIQSLTEAAVKMGFSASSGRAAAMAGLESQKRFDEDKLGEGSKLLEKLHQGGELGVVLLTRSYMSQDSGANLGIAEKLAQLNVIPVPLDFLPLSTVDPKKYTDRPYWSYEGRMLAGADIAARDRQLYGLALTNFGCGPNSFILKELEDVMGGKPLGQLEIDEHAAEAGLVTRLEAFVDTIKGYDKANKPSGLPGKDIFRGTSSILSRRKTLIIPRMSPHADVVAACMQACGVHAESLPEPDERNLLYSNQVTSGTECLPYRVTLGDFLRYYYDHGKNVTNVEGFMSGSFGPCRLGKYAIEQIRILKDLGFDLPIRTTVSNNAYADLGLGRGFERLTWKSVVAVDYLQKLLWRTRPYEKARGESDKIFDTCLQKMCELTRSKADLGPILKQATNEFLGARDTSLPRRPLIGINGEIYLRSNRFSNKDMAKTCEEAGLEVLISPMGEWLKYIYVRNLEDAVKDRATKKIVLSYIKKQIQEHDERRVASHFKTAIKEPEPSTADILNLSAEYLSSKCGSEAVLSIGTGIEWLKSPHFAGIISVMPHGCMPGGIVAAMAEKFASQHQKPWINLTYDGSLESNNAQRIFEFAELVKFCSATT